MLARMANRGGLYLWADERLKGRLDAQLIEWRDADLSFDRMVDELRGFDLEVSRETVRRWFKALPESESAA